MASSPLGATVASSQQTPAVRPAKARLPFQEDDSPTPSPVREAMTRTLPKMSYSQSSPGLASGTDANISAASDAEESDDSMRRPLGRAARRMLSGKGSPRNNLTSSVASSRIAPNTQGPDAELYSATTMISRKRKSMSSPARQVRSTLFVSPAKTAEDGSDDELPSNPFDGKTSKLAALVAGKRAERLEKEAEEEARRKERSDATHALSDFPDELIEGSQDAVNPEIERIMSDAAKPTRKASRKALLEMERETQRIARQQALAHQMKVRKKFTTADFFARFNFRPNSESNARPSNGEDTNTSSAPNSDATEAQQKEPVSTPPSSPPTPLDQQRALVEKGALSKLVPVRQDSIASVAEVDSDEELSDMAQLLSSSRAPALHSAVTTITATTPVPKKGLRLARLGKKAVVTRHDSSDDDLEILGNLPAHLSVFDKVKGNMTRQHTDSNAIHTLKHLSHLGTDSGFTGRRKKCAHRPSVNPQALEIQLRLRAKEQARAQHLERIAELKAKGIDVQSAEQREREQEEFENLLEKARQDAVEIRKAEKAAAKVRGVDSTLDEVVSGDESEDEDYVDGSGSEIEEDEHRNGDGNVLVDDAADESEDEGGDEVEEQEKDGEENEQEDDDSLQDGDAVDASGALVGKRQDHVQQARETESMDMSFRSQTPIVRRKFRKTRVVVDDDDESDTEISQPVVNVTPTASKDDPFAAFGFEAVMPGSSLMSPTQAFNATMQTPTQATLQDSLDVHQYLLPPSSSTLPSVTLDSQMQTQGDSQVSVVPSSQVPESQQINLARETQAPETPVPGMNRGSSSLTLETPSWVPTQDVGLPATWHATPEGAKEMPVNSTAEDATQDTVRLRISESPAPLRERKRLVRGQRALSETSEDEAQPSQTAKAAKKDAFREMARKRKEAMSAAELAEAGRETRRMMDEQAEESEDEYAGLGGDDYVAPETEQDRDMIDSSHIDVDERQLAAHYAERERIADEEHANQLYKDLMTGGLRRKQANMFDLDEDEDDLAVRRRQMRQREEARKRKLLLQDDNIAGLAEGNQSKCKDAFLKAIADDDERNDDILDLSDAEEDTLATQTQLDSQPSQQAEQTGTPLGEISGNKRRHEEAPEERLPAKQRRTQASAFRAPTSLLEVQESVSFLLDEPHPVTVGPSVLELSSDSDSENDQQKPEARVEDDDEDLEEELARRNDGGHAPDREIMPPPRLPASQRRTAAKPAVVDRLSLKRGSSNVESARGRTAWAAPANGSFKVPSLLRRATTNTALGANERGVTTSAGLSRENSGVKMGGTKKSSLAYQARDAERKAVVEASAKRRADNTARVAQLRRNASSGFGKGLTGQFE
ncbi:hypothetical protein DOTSEDRAFT_86867 [Dothistroma septosporum NZE10]|uniref:DNA replication checkpoint mediator MRC1 domain-containing protein n=1 Tax=Dothistroma septosporum (strain NZE10 / CBS 128990) TaxID=675120 RepID=N1PV38_DOTSN|nr:hypothetical protein DOTSEDRAFT_86867 [Dothistroma septosporum NZE10]